MEKSGLHLTNSIIALRRLIAEEQIRGSSGSELKIQDLQFLLVKSYLQNAAILSQLIDHNRALKEALQAKECLKETAKGLESLAKSQKHSVIGLSWNEGLDIMLEKFVYEITFRDPTESKQAGGFESTFALNEIPVPPEGLQTSPGSGTTSIIFWKHNPRNNEKYLKKELAKRYGENFKGRKMQTVWLEEFNIGNIMHLNPVTYKELLSGEIELGDILSENKLVELVLVYSCCLFSIATENRFICHKELDMEKKTSELNGPTNQITKNYQLLQNENFRHSFVTDCPLLNHFLASYHKNYSPNLESIPEEEAFGEESASMISRMEYTGRDKVLASRNNLGSTNVLDGLHDSRSFHSPLDSPSYYSKTAGKKAKALPSEGVMQQNSPNDMKPSNVYELQIREMLRRYERAKQLEEDKYEVERTTKPQTNHDSSSNRKAKKILAGLELKWKKRPYSGSNDHHVEDRSAQKRLLDHHTHPHEIGSLQTKIVSNRAASPATHDQNIPSKTSRHTTTVQRMLEGVRANKSKLDDFIRQHGLTKIKEASAQMPGNLFSKKASANLISSAPSNLTREGSRRSSAGKKKQQSPSPQPQPPAGSSNIHGPSLGQLAQGLSQPLSIKIENRDFIAKLMNINIIKIKPDLKSNQCFCKTSTSIIKRTDRSSKDKKIHTKTCHSSSTDNKSNRTGTTLSHQANPFARNKSSGNTRDIASRTTNSKKSTPTGSKGGHMIASGKNVSKTLGQLKTLMKEASRVTSSERTNNPSKANPGASGVTTNHQFSSAGTASHRPSSPKQRLFTLIKDIHETSVPIERLGSGRSGPLLSREQVSLENNIRKVLERKFNDVVPDQTMGRSATRAFDGHKG